MNRKVAIIASSLHPVIQRHIIEWGEDIIKEVPNTQFFLGSRKKEVPFATNYKLNSKKEYVQCSLKSPGAFLKSDAYTRSVWPLNEFRPDVIHLITSNAYPKIRNYLRKNNPKLIVGYRGYDINVFPKISSENMALTQEIFAAADLLQFVSHKLMETAVSIGADKNKCIVKNRSLRIRELQSKNENDIPIILSAGRLVWQKGYFFALQAIQILKQKGLNFEYHIIGDGVDANMIRFYIDLFGIKDKVVLLGEKNREEVFQKMQSSDIFLQTSVSEGLPLTIIEASLAGLPIVSTSIGGIPEAVLHEKTGLLGEACDPLKTAEHLETLIKDFSLRKEMGANAHQFIKENFSREEDVKDWRKIYNSV